LAAFLQAAPAVPQQQQPQPGPTADSTEKGSVAGRVTNALTGEPLKKARVQLRRSSPAAGGAPATVAVNTDEAGRFAFPDVYPGDLLLIASRTGFAGVAAASMSATGSTLRIALAPGERATDLNLRLTPQGAIAGRVVDENGEPARHVFVYALRPSYAQGVRRLTSTGISSQGTNDLGEYRIYGLTPARYYVQIWPAPASPGRPGIPAADDRAYTEVYYSNATDLDSATRVEVKAGAEVGGVNFTLHPARAVKVRGRVVNTTGQVPQRTQVMFSRIAGGSVAGITGSALANAKGEFEIGGLLPGSYSIVATATLPGNVMLSARETVDVGTTGIAGLQLSLGPGATLAGSVRVDSAAPASALDLTKLRVRLSSREQMIGSFLASAVDSMYFYYPPGVTAAEHAAQLPGAVNEQGGFVVPNVGASQYDVSVSGLPDPFYLKSVSFENQDTTNTGLDLSGTGRYRLDLVVSGDGAQISGVVLNGKEQPAGGATVVLLPADPELRGVARLYKSTDTAQNGQFALKAIPPGSYRIYAWESVESGAWFDPDFMSRYEKAGDSVSFDSQEQKTLNLKLLPAEGSQL
jgi:protocatechuate 3,4-dioxygenase beta subunit